MEKYKIQFAQLGTAVEVRVSSVLGNCVIHRSKHEDVAIIQQFVACGQKPELLRRVIEELPNCKIVVNVNHADLRVFAEQGFETMDDPVPPLKDYGLKQLTTRMVRYGS